MANAVANGLPAVARSLPLAMAGGAFQLTKSSKNEEWGVFLVGTLCAKALIGERIGKQRQCSAKK
jgi:hypothetical protein